MAFPGVTRLSQKNGMPSKYKSKEPCPECGSKDNVAVYDDGHKHCFGCGWQYQPGKDKPRKEFTPMKKQWKPLVPLPCELPKRGITKETCELFGYGIASFNGTDCQVASYKNQSGVLAAQHIRFRDKRFIWQGELSDIKLWGQDLWRQHNTGQTFVVITEGEIDAMSVSQVQGNKFPVVSLPSGAQSATKYVAANLSWLSQFVRIVICFDSDAPGLDAAEKVAKVLPTGKAAIANLPRKDANEMLLAGEGELLKDLLFKASPVRPDNIHSAYSLWEDLIKEDTSKVCSYPFPELNRICCGFRKQSLTTICAGTGVGKSLLCRELAHHFLVNGLRVGWIGLEESSKRSLQGILSIALNKPLHLDEKAIDQDELRQAFDYLFSDNNFILLQHFGSLDPDRLIDQITYMATGEECDVIFLDHISLVVSGLSDGDERKQIDVCCTKLRQVVEKTGVGLVMVSHLRRTDGKPAEEGGDVNLQSLRGSSSIAQLSDLVICGIRSQQDEATSNELQLKVLKNRHSGTLGRADKLEYNEKTGRLSASLTDFLL